MNTPNNDSSAARIRVEFDGEIIASGADQVSPISFGKNGREVSVYVTETFEESANAVSLYKRMGRDVLLRHVVACADLGEPVSEMAGSTVQELEIEGIRVMYFRFEPDKIFLMAALNGGQEEESDSSWLPKVIRSVIRIIRRMI